MICEYPDTGILKVSFEVFCQTPKAGLIAISLLDMDVQPSTKSYQLQPRKEGRGRSNPLTRALPMDHAGVSAPIPQL